MASFISRIVRNWRWWGGALSDHSGEQLGIPAMTSQAPVSPDQSLQLATVYACVDLLASTVAAFPLMVYRRDHGSRSEARDSDLWMLLHDSPNAMMTPMDFWRAMVVQLVLRGNAYAKIERGARGNVIALWPLASDQMSDSIIDGRQVYLYGKDGEQSPFEAREILHLKGIGTGRHGFSKLDFMSSTIRESDSLASFANTLADTANKPSGIVKVAHMTTAEQRQGLMNRLSAFKQGDSRFLLIDGDMEFSAVSITPQESQLLETRQFGVEEICRWFGVPPQLIGGSTSASWGNGISEITTGFEKYTIRPLVCSIEQTIVKALLTPAERREYEVEFSMANLLRASIGDRYSVYSTAVQNGLMSRNEVRAMENMEPVDGADDLTAQTSLAPLSSLGQVANNGEPGSGRVMKS